MSRRLVGYAAAVVLAAAVSPVLAQYQVGEDCNGANAGDEWGYTYKSNGTLVNGADITTNPLDGTQALVLTADASAVTGDGSAGNWVWWGISANSGWHDVSTTQIAPVDDQLNLQFQAQATGGNGVEMTVTFFNSADGTVDGPSARKYRKYFTLTTPDVWSTYSANLTSMTLDKPGLGNDMTKYNEMVVGYLMGNGGFGNDSGNSLSLDNIFVVGGEDPKRTWNLDADGAWNVDANWNPATAPNDGDHDAVFGNVITAARTVNLPFVDDGAGGAKFQYVRHITFDSPNSYTLAADPTNGSGLRWISSSRTSKLTVNQGHHYITAPQRISDAGDTGVDLNVTVAAGAQMTMTGTMANFQGFNIAKNGPGTLDLNFASYATNQYNPADTNPYNGSWTYNQRGGLTVNAGTVNVGVDMSRESQLLVNGAGTLVNLNVTTAWHHMNITDGTVVVAPGGGKVLSVGHPGLNNPIFSSPIAPLTISGTGKLDLNDNAMIVDYVSGTPSPLADIRAKLIAGRNVPVGGIGDGTWDGASGITSSAAAAAFKADGIESKVLGYAENSALPMGAFTTFAGQAVDDSAVLVKFTYNGDATLDGVVDDFDVIVVGALYDAGATTGHHWYEGDFNFDGKIDDSDVILLGAFYNPSAPVLSESYLAQQYGAGFAKAFEEGRALAVPEPATLSLLGVGAMGLLARRRRA